MIDPAVKQELSGYRQSIDNIDAALVHMLAERFRCTKAVGVLKANTICRRQTRRARNTRSNACATWRGMPIWIRISRKKFLNFIIHEVIRHHEAIAADLKD